MAGSFQGTKTKFTSEPGDIVYLSIEPSWHNEGITDQIFELATVENGMMSMIANKKYKMFTPAFIQMTFTAEEVQMIIEALQQIQESWRVNGKD